MKNKTENKTMNKTISLKQDFSGQWLYQIKEGEKVRVEWQYGPFDRAECVAQAKERFGRDCIEIIK